MFNNNFQKEVEWVQSAFTQVGLGMTIHFIEDEKLKSVIQRNDERCEECDRLLKIANALLYIQLFNSDESLEFVMMTQKIERIRKAKQKTKRHLVDLKMLSMVH